MRAASRSFGLQVSQLCRFGLLMDPDVGHFKLEYKSNIGSADAEAKAS